MMVDVERDRMMLQGEVVDFSKGKFKVKINDNHYVMCTLSGKIRTNQVKIMIADIVKLEISPYDTEMGRIVFRIRG